MFYVQVVCPFLSIFHHRSLDHNEAMDQHDTSNNNNNSLDQLYNQLSIQQSTSANEIGRMNQIRAENNRIRLLLHDVYYQLNKTVLPVEIEHNCLNEE